MPVALTSQYSEAENGNVLRSQIWEHKHETPIPHRKKVCTKTGSIFGTPTNAYNNPLTFCCISKVVMFPTCLTLPIRAFHLRRNLDAQARACRFGLSLAVRPRTKDACTGCMLQAFETIAEVDTGTPCCSFALRPQDTICHSFIIVLASRCNCMARSANKVGTAAKSAMPLSRNRRCSNSSIAASLNLHQRCLRATFSKNRQHGSADQ